MKSEYILLALLSNTIIFNKVIKEKGTSFLMPILLLFVIRLVLFQYSKEKDLFDNDTLMIISFIIVMLFFQIIK